MKNGLIFGMVAAVVLAFSASFASADDYTKNLPAVVKDLAMTKLTLDQGITVAGHNGKPLSAQYEIDGGHFQLSVFVSKGDDLLEVIVDYNTGAIFSSDKLTDPDDIKDAKRQVKAMEKASMSLDQAVAAAVKANPGYQAVQVIPHLYGDKVEAGIMLVKGGEVKKVTQKIN